MRTGSVEKAGDREGRADWGRGLWGGREGADI